jgi:pyruvate-formate lyase-activating enzyme
VTALSVAFVLPYGEPRDGFFPDTLLGLLCAEARAAGHRGEILRVYYDGHDAAGDAAIRARLLDWLERRSVDLVVFERLFDPDPVRAFTAGAPHRRALIVSRGDSYDPIEGVDYVVGDRARSPTIPELVVAFRRVLAARAAGLEPSTELPLERTHEPLAFRPVVEHDVIAPGDPPPVVRKTLFGNVGCPFADDAAANPHYAGLRLAQAPTVARHGCAFCNMGGDYQKRPDVEVVAALVDQALYFQARVPSLQELVLSDQHAIRYLAALLDAARAAGVRPTRWLFAARPDTFVRERRRVEAAIEAARSGGHAIEVYLSGFEAFCDRELDRYNKGIHVGEQLAAVAAMRELAASHPGTFAYARARGHSLILWNPWTTPEDLSESVETIRAHGLAELFRELGRNRLRLYRSLPVFHAAERDGALTDQWDAGDEGAARRKGYSVEHPWRFLDPRTRMAHDLASVLRDRLGAESEVGQLRAVVEACVSWTGTERDVPGTRARMLAGLDALAAVIGRLGRARGPGDPRRGTGEGATALLFGGPCNNGCPSCPNRDHWLDDRPPALSHRIDEARRGRGWILLAGREPTMHARFLDVVARARGPDRRPVAVVTNGRRFSYLAFARAARRVGLAGASVKLFAPEKHAADRVARAPGAFAEALRGVRHLRALGLPRLELRAPLHHENLERFEDYAALARAEGVAQIRVEAALDAVGLASLEEAARALDRLAAACAREAIALEVSPLGAGARFAHAPEG